MAAQPDPSAALPHRVETRRDRSRPWETFVTAPNKADATLRLRGLLPLLGSDCVRLVPVLPRYGAAGPRLNADQRAALRLVAAVGKLAAQPLAKTFGGAESRATRKRASDTVRALRDLGLIAADEARLGPGMHVLTTEGRAVAARLDAQPPHDAAPTDED
jgi:hypothetical protein